MGGYFSEYPDPSYLEQKTEKKWAVMNFDPKGFYGYENVKYVKYKGNWVKLSEYDRTRANYLVRLSKPVSKPVSKPPTQSYMGGVVNNLKIKMGKHMSEYPDPSFLQHKTEKKEAVMNFDPHGFYGYQTIEYVRYKETWIELSEYNRQRTEYIANNRDD
tara:strand:+ start:127 stop:603 length:477 start_codon:yes stop_codon:yes gene_type:complete